MLEAGLSIGESWNAAAELGYTCPMSDTRAKARTASWAVPSAEDDRLWQAMTREQQLAALQEHLGSADCVTPTEATIAEIVARARANSKRPL